MKKKSGFRSAKRCLRSLSKQVPANATKTLAEDTIFIGKSDRLLALQLGLELVGRAGAARAAATGLAAAREGPPAEPPEGEPDNGERDDGLQGCVHPRNPAPGRC